MDKRELYDSIVNLEEQTRRNLEQLGLIREELSHINEENHNLRMENQYLRDRLDTQLEKEESEAKKVEEDNPSGLTKSRLNLENIYEDGFHVCNLFFGQRREGDSPCAFCTDIIYGDRSSHRPQ